MTAYDPATWQIRHPVGSRMGWMFPWCDDQPIPVRVGRAYKSGVRVKWLGGISKGQWATVHPDDLRPYRQQRTPALNLASRSTPIHAQVPPDIDVRTLASRP